MRRAIGIAIAVHCCLLLAAGYIYVMRPEKREAVFRAFLHAEKTAPMKKIRTVPPKKELKKTPAVRPLRRERPIELIAVKKAITSAFTVKLPEVSGASYSPPIALVGIPEPTVAPERLASFWKREIKLKQREIKLESFGVTTLKPLGTPENPVTRLIFQIVGGSNCQCCLWDVGIFYPEHRVIASGVRAGESTSPQVRLGPYAVPPKQFIFFADSRKGSCGAQGLYLSTDPIQCHQINIGPNTIRYEWEVDQGGGDMDYNDLFFTVTFIGTQGES